MLRIKAARGHIPVDLLITNVQLANVLTGEIYPAEIAVHENTIVAVERPGEFSPREARETLDGAGQLAVPGLVDSHMHIESSLVTPAPFAEAALRRGTTTVAADPHEIANATGLEGVRQFVEASRGLPMGIFFLASTCVPAAAGLEHCQGELGADEIDEMLSWEGVIGLAEVMDARAVVDEDDRMSAILDVGRQRDVVIEGHNPMLRGRDLMAYIAAGVDSDHTLVPADVYVEKLRLGVTVQLQERYMSEKVIGAITALPQPVPTLCIVTDDVAPDYFEEKGHLDQVLRRAIALGLPPMQALQATTINPARRLRLYDRGAIAPGRRADVVLVESLAGFTVSTTISGGEIVVADGETQWSVPAHQPSLDTLRDSLHIDPVTPDAFYPVLPVRNGDADVRVIVSHRHGTTTEPGRTTVRIAGGEPQLTEHEDLCLIGVLARGGISQYVGFVENLGLRRGAVATSHAHDSHNLAVMGRDRVSMATAANAVIDAGGGIAVADGESVVAMTPLPIGGVVSDASVPAVAAQMRDVRDALGERGLEHPYLLMRLSTFTLPVASGLRITDMGYVLAEERVHVTLVVE